MDLAEKAGNRGDDEAKYIYSRLLLWEAGSTLKACFFEGSTDEKAFVADIAGNLLAGHNVNIRIDFGTAPTFRSCSEPGRRADVRVSFVKGCCSAYVGRTAHYPDAVVLRGPTVKLEGILKFPPQRAKRVVLHELLHTLGFEHEHQSPDADCRLLVAVMKEKLKLTDKQMDENLIRFQKNFRRYKWSEFDGDSIMRYFFEAEFFEQGDQSPCYLPEKLEPSPGDYNGLRDAYSTQPSVVVSRPRDIMRKVTSDVAAPEAVRRLASGVRQ